MKKLFGLIVVLILSVWTVRPLLSPGYFPMHDDTQVARVVEMGRALREGQFPVRWVSELGYGYGYPIFNFYGPLPYYAGGFFHALGFTGLTATKLMMGLGMALAGVTMFLAVSDIVGIAGGVLAAAFYMYAPYHAVDAYVRGAVGEYWALIFAPLIFWGFWRTTRGRSTAGILIGSAGVAGLIISHTILGYAGMIFVGMATLVLAVWHARTGHWSTVGRFVLLVLLGVGLSASFWLPAITEMKFTNVSSQISSTSDYHDHFVCVSQLWNSPWGFGGSAEGCLDGFSMKVGKEHLIIALIAILGLIAGFIKSRNGRTLVIAGTGIFLFSVFFMLPMSRGVWETLPLFAYVQYPWRFLAFAIFGLSLIIGAVTHLARQPVVRWAVVILSVGILLLVEAKRFMPQYMYTPTAGQFETSEDIRYRVSKISDEYLSAAVIRPKENAQIVRDTIPRSDAYSVEIVQNTDTYKKFEFRLDSKSVVRVNVAHFPGWTYQVNEFSVVPPLVNGLPELTVPSGFSVVQMRFTDTPVRTVGNAISIGTLGLCIYIYDRKNKKTIG